MPFELAGAWDRGRSLDRRRGDVKSRWVVSIIVRRTKVQAARSPRAVQLAFFAAPLVGLIWMLDRYVRARP